MIAAYGAAGRGEPAAGHPRLYSALPLTAPSPIPAESEVAETVLGAVQPGSFPERGEKREESRHRSVEQAVQSSNNGMRMANRNIRFRIHDESNDVQIQVVDTDKDKVILTIPSDEMIRLAMRMREFRGVGMMMDASS